MAIFPRYQIWRTLVLLHNLYYNPVDSVQVDEGSMDENQLDCLFHQHLDHLQWG